MFANIGGLDGQFTMAAVNQHGELHSARPAMVEQGVERGPDSAAGIEHVVAEHDVSTLYVETDGPRSHKRTNARRGQIIAVELDIEQACIDGALFDSGDQSSQPFGQRDAAALDAHQRQVFTSIAFFNDLVSQAHQRTLDLRGGHQPALHAQAGTVFGLAHGLSLEG